MLELPVVEDAMRRALALAARGPEADRNPRVGCVLLTPDGRIVAEGWHRGSGTVHAEIDALAQLPDSWRRRAADLTAVVTLEPCTHTGQTGPCSDALSEAGIGAVAFALGDPGSTSGGGGAALRARGMTVRGGVLEAEGRRLLGSWLARQPDADPRPASGAPPAHRPRVVVKWAQTLDGRTAAADGSSRWITGAAARADVHRRRADADAILVGTGTLLADDPSLTARDEAGALLVPPEEQPIPVVLGRRPIPATARLHQHPALVARGIDGPIRLAGDALRADLEQLYARGVRRLFVEGGPAVVSSLLARGLADEVLVYLAPALLGGPRVAITEIGCASIDQLLRLERVRTHRLGEDLLVHATLGGHAESTGEDA